MEQQMIVESGQEQEPEATAEPNAEPEPSESEPGRSEPEATPSSGSPEPESSGEPEPETPIDPTQPEVGVSIDGSCYPLCADASTDPDGDDWGWENEASCVVPGTATEAGGASCGSNAPAPAATPTSSEGYEVDGMCMAECALDDTDPDGDGWGWENEASCVVAGTDAAAGRLRCTFEGSVTPSEPAADPPMVPGDVTRPGNVQSSGFFVLDGRLYDRNGNDFVIRGINHGQYWFRDQTNTAFSAIADTGANAVRIVWETQGTASELRTAIDAAVSRDLVPIIELHDVTGEMSNGRLLDMARYYTQDSVLAVLVEFEDALIVNIANEWSGEDWVGGYEAAISEMRNAGIHHTLVIDANGWGQNGQVVLDDGRALLDADPEQNLLFSVHMYESFASENAITDVLQGAVDRQLPLIVGEFGHQHGNPAQQIPYQTILGECARLGLGYIPWSWKGNNSDVAYLDLSVDWAGNQLTDWGRSVIDGTNGIRSTAQRASLFLLGT